MNYNSPNEITFTSPQLQAIDTKIIVKNINNITGDQNQIDKIYQSIVTQLESKLLAWFDRWELHFQELSITISEDGKSYQIQFNPNGSYIYYRNDLYFQNQIDDKNEHQELPAFGFETNLNQLTTNLNQNDIKISFKNQRNGAFRFRIDGKIINHYENLFDYDYRYWDYYQIDFASLNDPLIFNQSYFANNVRAINDYLSFWKSAIEDRLANASNEIENQLLAIDPHFNPNKIFYVKREINELYQPEIFSAFYPITLEHSNIQLNCLLATTFPSQIDNQNWKYELEFNHLNNAIKIINDLKKLDQNGQLNHLKQSSDHQNYHLSVCGETDENHRLDLIFNNHYRYINNCFNVYQSQPYQIEDLLKWIQKQTNDLKTKFKNKSPIGKNPVL